MEIKKICERYMTIPYELRAIPHWVCWEKRPPNKEGEKPRKVPIDPITGHEAKSTDPNTWGTFEQAVNAYKRQPERLAGIGWVFQKGSGYVGIDRDNCIDQPELCNELVDVLQSYNEISTSGTGIHIICRGSLPEKGRKNDQAGVEMYEDSRYFVFTGIPYNSAYTEVKERQEEIAMLHKKYFPKCYGSKKEKTERACVPVTVDDERLLSIIQSSQNGTKFQMLYDGAWESLGYDSQSNADMALCSMLAFWTGRDADRMDALFRSSGLMRKKWDEQRGGQTYGQRTISEAINGCSEVYQRDNWQNKLLDWDSEIEYDGKDMPVLPKQEAKQDVEQETKPEEKVETGDNFDDLPPWEESPNNSEKIELAPEMIEGILRRGRKMMIAGPSKVGKTFLLINLAISFTNGLKWLGFQCKEARVLYINLEVASDTFFDRVQTVQKALKEKHPEYPELDNPKKFKIWNLRGKRTHGTRLDLDNITPIIKSRCKSTLFDVIIIDPEYKINHGNENDAKETADFCDKLDHIADMTGASVIYCHHFSKGADKYDNAQDRASGSGVFARDGDVILSLSLFNKLPNEIKGYVADNDEIACRLEGSIREFRKIKPVNLWFRYPLHELDETGKLENIKLNGDDKPDPFEEFNAAYDNLMSLHGVEWVGLDELATLVGNKYETLRKKFDPSGCWVNEYERRKKTETNEKGKEIPVRFKDQTDNGREKILLEVRRRKK